MASFKIRKLAYVAGRRSPSSSILSAIGKANIIEQLEKKVDKHNNLVERVYLIEQHEAVNDNKIKTAEHRIADLENEQNKERKI